MLKHLPPEIVRSIVDEVAVLDFQSLWSLLRSGPIFSPHCRVYLYTQIALRPTPPLCVSEHRHAFTPLHIYDYIYEHIVLFLLLRHSFHLYIQIGLRPTLPLCVSDIVPLYLEDRVLFLFLRHFFQQYVGLVIYALRRTLSNSLVRCLPRSPFLLIHGLLTQYNTDYDVSPFVETLTVTLTAVDVRLFWRKICDMMAKFPRLRAVVFLESPPYLWPYEPFTGFYNHLPPSYTLKSIRFSRFQMLYWKDLLHILALYPNLQKLEVHKCHIIKEPDTVPSATVQVALQELICIDTHQFLKLVVDSVAHPISFRQLRRLVLKDRLDSPAEDLFQHIGETVEEVVVYEKHMNLSADPSFFIRVPSLIIVLPRRCYNRFLRFLLRIMTLPQAGKHRLKRLALVVDWNAERPRWDVIAQILDQSTTPLTVCITLAGNADDTQHIMTYFEGTLSCGFLAHYEFEQNFLSDPFEIPKVNRQLEREKGNAPQI
ncbi:hypothetical protein BDZ89DRAFT_1036522 [Hymenopellis radicata]|nr:hypothetical protein BDZ89DRAFT_1036522 [Hymenopellis radicata]